MTFDNNILTLQITMKSIIHSSIAFTTLVICLLSTSLFAQGDDILFSVDGVPVSTDEFLYIYNKNNAGSPDYSADKVNEYLELYKKFKLKVHHARQMDYDTIPRLKTELKGYREQLAATYMNDNSVMGRLAAEAFERMQKEAEVSHILIRYRKNPSPADTARAYKRAMKVYNSIATSNTSFSDVAKSLSEDQGNKQQGGYIGFVRATLPKGYYALESAIYNMVPGNVSKPVRSPRGYHLVKLHSYRQAQPEMNLAHILVKKKKNSPDNNASAKRKIDDMHNRISNGVPFEQIAAKESMDAESARKGGRIGYVNLSEFDPEFEKAAMTLLEDGAISTPVETRVGYHIIKRLGVKEMKDFKSAKRSIENEIRLTERQDQAKAVMINRIKEDEQYELATNALNKMIHQIDQKKFYGIRWKRPSTIVDETLFSFKNGTGRSTQEFVSYLEKNPKTRMQLKSQPKAQAIRKMLDDYVGQVCLEIEKNQLEQKHPEFASLMREYEEGILLFEVTKNTIWDKASSDTVGLQKYFTKHKANYVYPEQIEVVTYNIPKSDAKSAKKIAKKLSKLPLEKIKTAYPNVTIAKKTVAKDDLEASKLIWRGGKMTKPSKVSPDSDTYQVTKTLKVIPSRQKALSECRGYVISDYQDVLESQWVETLRAKYPVKVNEKVLQRIIK